MTTWLEASEATEHHLTDITEDKIPFIEEAARVTGFPVFISKPTGGYLSHGVWTSAIKQDHGPFWAEYRCLLEKAQTASEAE